MTAADDAAIRNLIGRVAWLTDNWKSKEEYLSNYTLDCSWQIEGMQAYLGHKGMGERLQFVLDNGICGPGLATRHCVTSMEVIAHADDPDTATVQSFCIMLSMKDQQPIVSSYGEYHDTVRRENGRWLMVKRHIRPAS
jgi:hypothetical protein